MVSIKAGYRRFTAAYHASYCRLFILDFSKISRTKLISEKRKEETKNNVKNHYWNFRTLKCMLQHLPWPWPGKVANSSVKTSFVKFVTISVKGFSSQTSSSSRVSRVIVGRHVGIQNWIANAFDLNSASKTLLLQWKFNVIEVAKEGFKVHL